MCQATILAIRDCKGAVSDSIGMRAYENVTHLHSPEFNILPELLNCFIPGFEPSNWYLPLFKNESENKEVNATDVAGKVQWGVTRDNFCTP